MRTIRFGTRKSRLAVTQTEWVIQQLQKSIPELKAEMKTIVTKGDRILNVTLSKVGGKGLFVKEIERALLDKEIDVAIHSMKDLPAEMAPGLTLAAVSKREDPRDCFISRHNETLDELPSGAVVGTSSLRRQAQLKAYRSDLEVKPVRGNIETRLRKMREGEFDAIVLAAAGLHRVGWHNQLTDYIDIETMVPAVGQGALGIQCRANDEEMIELLKAVDDEEAHLTVAAERAFLHRLDGNCQVPIGAYGLLEEDAIKLTGLIAEPDGSCVYRKTSKGTDPVRLGEQLADELVAMGAGRVLEFWRERGVQ